MVVVGMKNFLSEWLVWVCVLVRVCVCVGGGVVATQPEVNSTVPHNYNKLCTKLNNNNCWLKNIQGESHYNWITIVTVTITITVVIECLSQYRL